MSDDTDSLLNALRSGLTRAKSHRHKAVVIEVEKNGGAAVKFRSGRIEFVLHRGLVPPFEVGQKGIVDYVNTGHGYEWVFIPNKRKK